MEKRQQTGGSFGAGKGDFGQHATPEPSDSNTYARLNSIVAYGKKQPKNRIYINLRVIYKIHRVFPGGFAPVAAGEGDTVCSLGSKNRVRGAIPGGIRVVLGLPPPSMAKFGVKRGRNAAISAPFFPPNARNGGEVVSAAPLLSLGEGRGRLGGRGSFAPPKQRIRFGKIHFEDVVLEVPDPLLLDGQRALEFHLAKPADKTGFSAGIAAF